MQTPDETVRRFIRERRAAGADRGDLLSMVLLAADEEGDGGRFTDEQARDQSMTLLIAGHDTTAAGLMWLFYCLGREPQSPLSGRPVRRGVSERWASRKRQRSEEGVVTANSSHRCRSWLAVETNDRCTFRFLQTRIIPIAGSVLNTTPDPFVFAVSGSR
jgi:hypothetical protein